MCKYMQSYAKSSCVGLAGKWIQGKSNKKELIIIKWEKKLSRDRAPVRGMHLWKTRCDPRGQRCDHLCYQHMETV